MLRGVCRAAALCLLLLPAAARAGGFEVTSQGTVPLGRGGAYAARASDPMMILYSPAALADLHAPELLLDTHLVFYRACADRSGTWGTNGGGASANVSRFGRLSDYADEPIPEVCRDGGVGVTPNLLFALPLTDGLGIGLGLLTPAGAGASRWGDGDITLGGRRPSPVRYMLAETDSMLLDWSLGVGYRPIPELALGVTAHWAMAWSESATFVAFGTPEDPAYDVRSEIEVSDLLIPGFTATVKVTPWRWLEAVVGVRWHDDVTATGEAELIFGEYATNEMAEGHTATVHNPVEDFAITTPQQTRVWASFRYAHLRESAALPDSRGRDPMRDELFDVELTVGYEFNSRVDAFRTDVPEDTTLEAIAYGPGGVEVAVPPARVPDRVVPKGWKDQLTLHLGGDVNILPERLALRAGASYETRGVDPAYLSVDFMPLSRLGLHTGLTLRLGGLDLSAAYAHVFQETVTVQPDEARYRALSATAPESSSPVVNAGRYEAGYDVLSIGARYRFE